MMDAHKFIAFLFVLLVVFLYSALLLMIRWALAHGGRDAAQVRSALLRPRIALALWFAVTGFLASRGFFSDFQATPPRMLVLIGLTFLSMFSLARGPWFQHIYARFNARVVVGLQSFRIVMEVILFLLFHNGLLSELLTLEGRNFDLVTGLTAPIVTRLWMKPGQEKWGLVLLWNVLGVSLLLNVIVHGILSTPTPIQVFFTDPPNTIIADFPYIWLPTFVVPMAMFLHIVSIRHCLRGLRGCLGKN